MPRRPGTVALALAVSAVLALAIAAAILADSPSHNSSSQTPTTTTGSEQAFNGAALPGNANAPDFKLTDQSGRNVALTDYRGQVVVLTFLYSTCGDTCIVIAQQIRGALNELADEHAHPPTVLIVSADPAVDTQANIRSFLAAVSLSGRVQYLTGTLARLRSVWRAYGVKPASAGAQVFDEYAPVLLLDRAGQERVLFESEELTPEGLSQDIRKLDGDPTRP